MKAVFVLALAALLVSTALLSGCLQQNISDFGKSKEQRAIELASATREASLMQRLGNAFSGLKNCSAEELVKEVKRLNPSAPEPTRDQREAVKTAIAKAQSCLPLLRLSVQETRTHVYDARYSFSFPGDCNAVPELQRMGSGVVEVGADIDRGASSILGGDLSSNPSVKEAVDLLSANYGSCSLALLFPGARWDLNSRAKAIDANAAMPRIPDGNSGAIAITGSA